MCVFLVLFRTFEHFCFYVIQLSNEKKQNFLIGGYQIDVGMLHVRKRRAELLEQQTRQQQQQRYIRNDEKWHIRGEFLKLSFLF